MSGLFTIRDNLPAIQDGLRTVARRIGRVQPLYKGIGHVLELSTRGRFDKETDPKGRKWKPLKASTLKRKRKKGKSPKILHQDMQLRDTIHSQAEEHSLMVGSPQKYAAIQHLGGKAGKGKRVTIDPREYLGIGEQDEKDILHETWLHLDKATRI